MKKRFFLLLICLMLPFAAAAEELQKATQDVMASLQMDELENAVSQSGWFDEGAEKLLTQLASGQPVLTSAEVWQKVMDQTAGVLRKSLWRMSRLMIPALLVGAAEWIRPGQGTAGKAARYAGLLMTMAFLVSDLREHVALAQATVDRMANWMQAIFPLMVTLLAAVGGTASSAFYQPAVIAAAGSMTTLIQQVTMPLAVSVAVLTMTGALSEGLRLGRLCRLFKQAANWTLGFGFTVFIGVMTTQGVSAAVLDGVSIRTAKYAIDHFVPIVGGMFSDTVDTLVGCSLVIHNAVGALGLLLLLAALVMPLVRTVLTMFLYRAAAALMEPLSDNPLCRAIGGYADVFSLLFIIQLSVGAMFVLLIAQLITIGDMTVMLR